MIEVKSGNVEIDINGTKLSLTQADATELYLKLKTVLGVVDCPRTYPNTFPSFPSIGTPIQPYYGYYGVGAPTVATTGYMRMEEKKE